MQSARHDNAVLAEALQHSRQQLLFAHIRKLARRSWQHNEDFVLIFQPQSGSGTHIVLQYLGPDRNIRLLFVILRGAKSLLGKICIYASPCIQIEIAFGMTNLHHHLLGNITARRPQTAAGNDDIGALHGLLQHCTQTLRIISDRSVI